MKKTGEDQPPKASPSQQDLENLAKQKPRADMDTDYQNSKKEKLPGVKEEKPKADQP